MTIDDFIVPVICENPEHKEALQKHLYELGPAEQESSIFWLSDRTSLDLTHLQQFLYGEVWTTATGKQESIFSLHSSQTELDDKWSASLKKH